MSARKLVRVSRNLFKRDGWLYFRWKVAGVSRKIALHTKDIKEARETAREIRKKIAVAAFEQAASGGSVAVASRLSQVLAFYKNAKCPLRSGATRSAGQLKEELRRVGCLERILGSRNPAALSASDWSEYAKKRSNEVARGDGARTLDLEWVTLSAAYAYAAQHPNETGISGPIPIPKPKRHRRSSDVVHCRDFQPRNAEELHAIAEKFLMGGTTEVFGWYVLLAAMIGQRLSEMLKLRLDAKDETEPGFDDGENLWLYRSKTHKGTAATVHIGPELRSVLGAHKAWIQRTAPDSVWFFPSPRKKGAAVHTFSVTHAMNRVSKELKLPPRTAHGLRSYFVNVLRSRNISDAEIALRIGHKSGGRLIVETYGERLPGRLEWMPETKPAWLRFDPTRPKIVAGKFS